MIKVKETEIPTNLETIKSFEKLIQARLPEKHKEWLLKYNGKIIK
ncbi:hypothetical protein [Rickettsia asembonensis]|nr:hypothetical protein [Rickettsia asembonensis]WCR56708.1 MAG: hypothetical protein PG979_000765 [Rickettsia asembonensis]